MGGVMVLLGLKFYAVSEQYWRLFPTRRRGRRVPRIESRRCRYICDYILIRPFATYVHGSPYCHAKLAWLPFFFFFFFFFRPRAWLMRLQEGKWESYVKIIFHKFYFGSLNVNFNPLIYILRLTLSFCAYWPNCGFPEGTKFWLQITGDKKMICVYVMCMKHILLKIIVYNHLSMI